MPLDRSIDIINFLAHLRFADEIEAFDDKEVREFCRALTTESEASLRQRLDEVMACFPNENAAKAKQIEANLPFNRVTAIADLRHWCRMETWTLDEGVALSLGRDPRKVDLDGIYPYQTSSCFAREYIERSDIVERASDSFKIATNSKPVKFIEYLDEKGIGYPRIIDDLLKRESIKSLSESVSDLTKERDRIYEELSTVRARLDAGEKGLPIRSRETLLKLVIGMAAAFYGYDPRARRSGTASEIRSELARVGIELSNDTIRTWLREAAEFLPGKTA